MREISDWNYDNEQWTKLPSHLKHLPLFTRHFDLTSFFFRVLWAIFLKGIGFRYYIRVKVVGSFEEIHKKHPKLLLISNHASHLDAVSIASVVPFKYWKDLYLTAAKDYWFANDTFTFFSKHCLGAIPIDRKDKKGEAVKLCISLLQRLDRIWMILFPEGTRSKDGYIQTFKRGVSMFAKESNTPILFLYIEGNSDLWPRDAFMPKPGKLTIHIGPVQEPAPINVIDANYRAWVLGINPDAYKNENQNIEQQQELVTETNSEEFNQF
jgi:1-acyl-sn-glycerol-3-phosphate acyltransferase